MHQVLDAADQVAEAGVVLIHDGRAAGLGMIHHHLDLIALKAPGVVLAFVLLVDRASPLDATVEQVLLHRVEKFLDGVDVLIAFAQIARQVGECRRQRVTLSATDRLAQPLAPAGKLFQQVRQTIAPVANLLFDDGTLGLGQRLKVLRRHGFALARRSENEPFRRLQQREIVIRTTVTQRLQRAFLTLLVRILQGIDAVLVSLALQRGIDGRRQITHEGLHVVAKLCPPASRQAQQARTLWILKVVDVTEVKRCLALRGQLGQQAIDDGVPAGTGLAQHIDVVAGVLHGQAETQRLISAGLFQPVGQVGQLGRCLELQGFGFAAGAQAVRFEAVMRHQFFLCGSPRRR